MQAEKLQLRQEKQVLQEIVQKLKKQAVEVFTEVETLNERIVILEK